MSHQCLHQDRCGSCRRPHQPPPSFPPRPLPFLIVIIIILIIIIKIIILQFPQYEYQLLSRHCHWASLVHCHPQPLVHRLSHTQHQWEVGIRHCDMVDKSMESSASTPQYQKMHSCTWLFSGFLGANQPKSYYGQPWTYVQLRKCTVQLIQHNPAVGS